MIASTDPVFCAFWTTGPDPARDGVFFCEAAGFPAEEGRRDLFAPLWTSPYDGGRPPRHASRRLADLGLHGERLRALPHWRDAVAAAWGELAARPVVLPAGRAEFLARWALLCPDRTPPAVLDLESLAAFLHPQRGGGSFAELFTRWCGRPPAAEGSAAEARRLCEALVRAHFERPAPLRLLFARGFEDLSTDAGAEEAAAWDWLQLLRRLLDHPSRYAGGEDQDLFFAAPADGAFEADLEIAPLDPDRVLKQLQPRFAEDYQRDFARAEKVPLRADAPGEPLPEARAILARYFDLLPRQFAPEGAAAAERPSQRALGVAVADAFDGGQLLLADAPTGTGKTLAYLGPLLLWSAHSGARGALSTYTRALQEQAYFRELPRALALLREAGLPPERMPRVALLKGRGNHLCGRALADLAPEPGAASLIARATWLRLVLFWCEDPAADLDGFPLAPGVPSAQPARAARAAQRTVEAARALPECCRGRAALRCGAGVRSLRAERAHLVVTNHAYVLSKPTDFAHVVFDECDHLHEVTLSVRSYDLELDEATALVEGLQRGRGRDQAPLARLARLLQSLAPGDTPERLLAAAEEAFTHAGGLDAAAVAVTRELRTFQRYQEERKPDLGREEEPFLLHEYLHDGRGEALATALRALRDAVDGLDGALRTCVEELGDVPQRAAERLRWVLRRPLAPLAHWREGLGLWIGGEAEGVDFSADLLFEVAFENRRRPLLALKWLLPQEWLGRVFHPALHAAAYVSATTRLRGGFQAMKGYLGLDLVEESTAERAGREVLTFAGAPTFDPRRALVCVPEDAPAYATGGPGHEAWLEYVERVLVFLAERTRGRTLGLFTNRLVLQRVGERLAPRFRALGLPLYWQGMPGLRKEEIIPLFRRQTDSTLLGLDTFWYGVDFPGETCEYVVIPKLPYGPLDPYVYAQMARMGRAQQRNRIYLPQALAMFRQGCGRLLRSEQDRGAIFLLDRRALEKRHADFLAELPRGPEAGQAPHQLVADTADCFRAAFAHMDLLADLARRGLSADWNALGAEAEPEPDALS
jgi:ATP-dependent DNA helicase DinG